MNKSWYFLVGIILVLLISCEQKPEIVEEVYQAKYAHEAYLLGLQKAGIAESALGSTWISAAKRATESPIQIKPPFEEIFIVLDDEPRAYGYTFSVQKGQKIDVSINQLSGDSMKIFMDAFRVSADSTIADLLIASADSSDLDLAFEVVSDGNYTIRFQSELLRKGKFKINISTVPSLQFPVAGKGKSAIGSLFGVPRDAGKRVHEGIDIFARRHTPIIAPCNGNINRAGMKEGSLGGKVIWMRDTVRNITLYFAHLEDVGVIKGQNVQAGDTIGTVGNSGNAITTHPHLHFGIYQDGAVDPYDFVVPIRTKASRLLAKESYVGQTARIRKETILRKESISKKNIEVVEKLQLIDVIGVTASYYHVSLPNKTEGFIFYDDIQTIDRPIKNRSYQNFHILADPKSNSISMKFHPEKSTLKILAKNKEYLYVETEDNTLGWIQETL